MLVGFSVCTVNGYLQGRYLTNYADYDQSWFFDPRFLVGHLLFLVGMAINIHSDSLLRALRKPGDTAYRIPYGMSGPHTCIYLAIGTYCVAGDTYCRALILHGSNFLKLAGCFF